MLTSQLFASDFEQHEMELKSLLERAETTLREHELKLQQRTDASQLFVEHQVTFFCH